MPGLYCTLLPLYICQGLLSLTLAIIITVIISYLNILLSVWLDITFQIVMKFCYEKVALEKFQANLFYFIFLAIL